MTQIANRVASTGGQTMGAASKAHGMKQGGGSDFAAIVAGFGLQDGDSGQADADGLTLAAEGGTGAEAEGEEGKTPEVPMILDLSLGAAAQSAMADMVVPPPLHLVVVNREKPEGATETPSIAGIEPGVAAPANVRGARAAMAAASLPAALPVAGGDPLPAVDTTATTQTATIAPPAVDTALPARFAASRHAARTADPLAASVSAVKADTTVSVDAEMATAMPFAEPAPAAQIASAIPAARDAFKNLIPVSAPHAALRQTMAAANTTTPATAGAEAATTVPGTPLVASDNSSMSAAIPTTGQPTTDAARRPVGDAPRQTAIDIAALQKPLASPVAGAVAVDVPMATAQNQTQPQAQPAAASDPAETPVVRTPAQAAYAAIQPVMSSLHRATAAAPEVKSGDPAPITLAPGDTSRRDPGTASDGSSDRESGGAALGNDGMQSASTTVDTLSGGSQFADIVQNLPPVVQSRIGAATDVAPVAAPATDVGATLQGQVIDMTVGGQWIDRMAKEITALAQGTGHSRFQLSPPNLGRIQIDVWQGDDGGRVQLLTETDEAARHLRDGQSSLQADARLAALQLSSITIDRASSSFDTPSDQSNPQQNTRQQQSGDQNSQGSQSSSTQTGSQQGGQQNPQQNAQAGLQAGLQGGNSNGQGKSSPRRDVLNQQADIVNQQGGNTGRDGDRLVRYA